VSLVNNTVASAPDTTPPATTPPATTPPATPGRYAVLSTIYTAPPGMLGFSNGLDVVSSNVPDLNTPGRKSPDLDLRDLFYRYTQGGGSDQEGERSQIGAGLDTKGTRTAFREGEMQDSGNPLDVAIDGNGFLVLQPANGVQLYGSGGEQVYTRAGQLE